MEYLISQDECINLSVLHSYYYLVFKVFSSNCYNLFSFTSNLYVHGVVCDTAPGLYFVFLSSDVPQLSSLD